MVSSMNIGGVEKSLLSLISSIPKEEYDITILVLQKKGGLLKDIPAWVKVKEVSWYRKLKPIIMQPPQQTIKNYHRNNQYIKLLSFFLIYLISKIFNNRYLYYKYVFHGIHDYSGYYDVAFSYQSPTDVIDFYIAHKISANKRISWVHFDVSKHEMNKKLYEKLYKKFKKIFVVSNEAKEKLITKIPSVAK